jgi:GTP-binding protein EngB required for normal cell division
MMTQGLLKRKRLLTERQEALVVELRGTLNQLIATLENFGSDVKASDMRALRDAVEHLDELFLLVIVGEFNSGKSTFINALLGSPILPEGVTPTTDRITLLRHGDMPYDEERETYLVERYYPADVLRHLTIVDTPGTNAVIRRHEELTQTFVPRADLVLFTTSADRPFTESERVFMEIIKDWGKKIVMILNKSDILDQEEVEQVINFIRTNAEQQLGTTPEVFAVSARNAIKARSTEPAENGGAANNEQLWKESKVGDVEHYIVETLDEQTRVRLKLLSPLGVAERLVRTYSEAVAERLGVLHEDFQMLDNIDQQLTAFRNELMRDVEYYLNDIDKILDETEQRGLKFFDDNLRLARTPDLLRSERLQRTFEEEVVGDLAQQIDQRIQVLVDWSVEKNLLLWQNVTDYISRRRAPRHSEGIMGDVGGSFDYNRSEMLHAISNTAQNVVNNYDRKAESQALAHEVRSALFNTALTGVGAVGIGTGLVMLLSGALFDATGILFATALAASGLFILPAKRRSAKKAFSERMREMKTQIHETVRDQCGKETDRSLARIREAISPYTRFVRSKREQLSEIDRDLNENKGLLERLRRSIES